MWFMSSGEKLSRLSKASLCNSGRLTFPSHKKGIKAQVVNTEVHPTLPGDLALPVAAGVVVDEFLLLGHPKQPMEFHNGFFKLLCVIVFLHVVDFVILCNDALSRNDRQSTQLVPLGQELLFFCTLYTSERKKKITILRLELKRKTIYYFQRQPQILSQLPSTTCVQRFSNNDIDFITIFLLLFTISLIALRIKPIILFYKMKKCKDFANSAFPSLS